MGAVLRPAEPTGSDFEALREFLSQATGIRLNPSKRAMVHRRLSRRLRELGLDSFTAYLGRLERDETERQRAVDALTTNLTEFYRERHHFELLARELQGRTRAVLWSAGCSTGQEAWSLAIEGAEVLGADAITVLGTDINAAAVAHGEEGIYDLADVEEWVPLERRQRWFLRGRAERRGLARVKPELVDRVHFRQANLHGSWRWKGPFDAIFCRNVLIYFEREAQEALLERFWAALRPGGLLCLGHSESVLSSQRFRWVGQTAYRCLP